MSNNSTNTNTGKTLGNTVTGGIQDVSALLPLIGTEQCEKHVGSALERGWLYAAATPLSIFGSLGIVKAGISILIASFNVYFPKFSLTLYGAKALHNAGFILPGTVAPMIGLDSEGRQDRRRYQAENRFVKLLTDRRIDDPEKHSIDHRSIDWNIYLILSSLLLSSLGLFPYIPVTLELGGSHIAWLYPALRVGGSVVACITCQFILQHRILYLVKSRLLFMSVDRLIKPTNKTPESDGKPGVDTAQRQNAKVADALTSSGNDKGEAPSTDKPYGGPKITFSGSTRRDKQTNGDIEIKVLRPSDFVWDESFPPEECIGDLKRYLLSESFSSTDVIAVKGEEKPTRKREDFLDELDRIRTKHFPSPTLDQCFFVLSWTCLLLSLPAIIIGYVGCFTIVSSTPEGSNAPLKWLGIEAALALLRILVWAMNPRGDEVTDVILNLKLGLSDQPPLVTTEKSVELLQEDSTPLLPSLPWEQFLQHITPYTGPLEQFQGLDNTNLVFTLTGRQGRRVLYMTSQLTQDDEAALTIVLLPDAKTINYYQSAIDYKSMIIRVGSELPEYHPSRVHYRQLCDAMEDYYHLLLRAMRERAPPPPRSRIWVVEHLLDTMPSFPQNDRGKDLMLQWTLEEKELMEDSRKLPTLTVRDAAYLQFGDKTKLIRNWENWNTMAWKTMQEAWLDARHAVGTEKSEIELDSIDYLLLRQHALRELTLVHFLLELENFLHEQWNTATSGIEHVDRSWLASEWKIGRQTRLDNEKKKAKERMEKARKEAAECAEKQGRSHTGWTWRKAQELVDKKWEEAIPFLLNKAVEQVGGTIPKQRIDEQVGSRFVRWNDELEAERNEMAAAVNRIKNGDSGSYEYPNPEELIWAKFGDAYRSSTLALKLSSAMTYYDTAVINDVISKPTTRSVIGVTKDKLQGIKPNEHLLYIGNHHGSEISPDWVRRNRERWWETQTENSFTFYLSPVLVYSSSVAQLNGPIGHIMIFLKQQSRIRLCLLHAQYKSSSVFVQQGEEQFLAIPKEKILEMETWQTGDELRWDAFDLEGEFEGQVELDLVTKNGWYCLRDIIVEFLSPQSDNGPEQLLSVPGPSGETNKTELD